MADDICRGSVIGVHDADRAGRCRWCGQSAERPVPAPDRYPGPSELTEAYGQFYDPDWGVER